jgi:mannose-6-phosphate isomerase-like protein (cupin superfamily)
MAQTFDLSATFIHLADGGAAEPVKATPALWSGSTKGTRYDRLLGAFDFSSSRDLHASMQEVHPLADEVLVLVSGAIDVVLEEADAERTIALEAGEAAIVPRGVWHRLVMRQPGRLVFINSRTNMQSRSRRTQGSRPRSSSPI